MPRRVVITGIGLITPIGIGKKAFWDSVSNGVSGVKKIESFDTTPYRTKIAAQVKNFNPSDFLSPQKVHATDRFSQFALIAAAEAVQDSRLIIGDHNRNRIGVTWGSSETGINSREAGYRQFFLEGPKALDPMTMPRAMGVAAATHIAIEYGVTGLNYSFTNTCSSSAASIGEGYRLIKHGYVDAMIAGGSEAPITPAMLCGWCKLRALSTRNDDSGRAVRPFSLDRDGPVLGEGAGAILLESLEHALERSSPIYGEVIGYWSNSDAHHLTFPKVQGEIDVMRGALEDGGVSVDEVD
ncbi:MAG: beta-ketoacyl-[acyl-carrier-protein] synthase family protein [Nitrospirae bacterium]|nr:beta-ketoacyl-[acyl-carrier-protein] synthase family protein [Nitrospirota bacterium]